MRALLVVFTVTTLCLGLTGLRVTLLEQLGPAPDGDAAPRLAALRLAATNPVDDPEPPPGEPPREYIARGAEHGHADQAAPAEARPAALHRTTLLRGVPR